MKSQNLSVFTIFSVDILTMADQGAFDHKYFITLALQNKMPWNALPFIIEGLTQTLEKSKEVNKFLLQELEKSHTKIQSLEGLIVSKSSANENTDKNSAKSDIFNSLDVACEVAKLKRSGLSVEKISNKSIEELKCTSHNESLLTDVEIIDLESETNEFQTTKEILQEVYNFDHEMFAFESELKIKTEFKIETAEGIETQKTEFNANQRPESKNKVNVRKELKSFNCSSCDKTFKSYTSLWNHKQTHEELKCRFCNKKFLRRGYLSNHEAVKHEFECKFCEKKFIMKGSLVGHERVFHVKKQFFECKFCNGLFMSSHSLDSHLKLKHKKCLKTHEIIHTGEKPQHCKKSCKSTEVETSNEEALRLRHERLIFDKYF